MMACELVALKQQQQQQQQQQSGDGLPLFCVTKR
jgi:hypothetical protein